MVQHGSVCKSVPNSNDSSRTGDGELEKLREDVGISNTFSLVDALFQCRAMFATTHKSVRYPHILLCASCQFHQHIGLMLVQSH